MNQPLQQRIVQFRWCVCRVLKPLGKALTELVRWIVHLTILVPLLEQASQNLERWSTSDKLVQISVQSDVLAFGVLGSCPNSVLELVKVLRLEHSV